MEETVADDEEGLKIGTEWFRLVYIQERTGAMGMNRCEIDRFLEKY